MNRRVNKSCKICSLAMACCALTLPIACGETDLLEKPAPKTSIAGETTEKSQNTKYSSDDAFIAADQALKEIVSKIRHATNNPASFKLADIQLDAFAKSQEGGPAVTARIYEFRRFARRKILGALENAQSRKSLNRKLVLRVLPLLTKSPVWYSESLTDNLQCRRQTAEIIRALDFPEYLLSEVARDGLNQEQLLEAQTRAFQSELASPDFSQSRIQDENRKSELYVSVTPIKLELHDNNDGRNHTLKGIGVQPAGNVDVVWGFSGWHGYGTRVVCIMSKPGKLRPIFEIDNKHDFGNACFDGKYVWLPVCGRDSRLLVIDPRDDEILSITRQVGLSRFRRCPLGVALAPGHVLWSGKFNDKDGTPSYLMNIDVNSNPVTVKYLRQSPYHHNSNDYDGHALPNKQLAFKPKCILPLRDQSGAIQQLVLGRWSPKNVLYDLNTGQGVTLGSRIPSHLSNKNLTQHEGALYWTNKSSLWRLGKEDLNGEAQLASVPENGLLYFDQAGRVFLFGQEVWTAPDVFEKFERVASNLPSSRNSAFHELWESTQYGMLFYTSTRDGWQIYQVSFE